MKLLFVADMENTFSKCISNLKEFSLSALSDIIFFFLYGLSASRFSLKIAEYMEAIVLKAGENSFNMGRIYSGSSIMQIINDTPEIRYYLNKILILLALSAVAMYITYTFLQAISWRYVFKVRNIDLSLISLIKRFSKLNIIWFPIVIVLQIASFLVFLGQAVMQKLNPDALYGKSILFSVVWWAMVYFVFISYSLIPKNKSGSCFTKSFSVGIKKSFQLLPALLLVFLIVSALSFVVDITTKGGESYLLWLVWNLAITIPMFTFFKAYFSSLVDNVMRM